ncbi:MAG TPA: hypothetical protein VF169_21055 [Albitalea sp.]|uniref:hypothetical protein n=1 Tax=Piscinibacter sp. TaxID=1903157 RepID=UPI002ED12543
MKTRTPSLAIVLASLLFAGSAMAQGGDNPAPAGSANAKQESQSATMPKAAHSKAATKHASARHAKHMRHARQGTTSSSGTQAAGGVDRDTRAALSRCTAKTDRSERAECARQAWESHHGAS